MARGKNKNTLIQVKSATISSDNANLITILGETNVKVRRSEFLPRAGKLLTEKPIDTYSVDAGDIPATHKETVDDNLSAIKQITPQQDDQKGRVDELVDVDVDAEFIELNTERLELKKTGVDKKILVHELKIEDLELNTVEQELKSEGQELLKTEITQTKIEYLSDIVDEVLIPAWLFDEERHTKESKKKKKKKEKKEKKTKSKKEANQDNSGKPDTAVDNKRPVRLEPIVRRIEQTHDHTLRKDERLKPKSVGCFGFFSTWLAKRKEKRRAKKRKAIKARNVGPVENLVEYEHKTAKGGVAFTLEIDNRPIIKSVLPPIKQRPGPIRMAAEQRLELADSKRKEHIEKKIENARAQSRLVREVATRRAQNENDFKNATRQKIKEKEDRAFRAASRLEDARNERCQSRMMSRLDVLASKWESVISTQFDEMDENAPSSPY